MDNFYNDMDNKMPNVPDNIPPADEAWAKMKDLLDAEHPTSKIDNGGKNGKTGNGSFLPGSLRWIALILMSATGFWYLSQFRDNAATTKTVAQQQINNSVQHDTVVDINKGSAVNSGKTNDATTDITMNDAANKNNGSDTIIGSNQTNNSTGNTDIKYNANPIKKADVKTDGQNITDNPFYQKSKAVPVVTNKAADQKTYATKAPNPTALKKEPVGNHQIKKAIARDKKIITPGNRTSNNNVINSDNAANNNIINNTPSIAGKKPGIFNSNDVSDASIKSKNDSTLANATTTDKEAFGHSPEIQINDAENNKPEPANSNTVTHTVIAQSNKTNKKAKAGGNKKSTQMNSLNADFGLQLNPALPINGGNSYSSNLSGQTAVYTNFVPGAFLSFRQKKSSFGFEVNPWHVSYYNPKTFYDSTTRIQIIGDSGQVSTYTKNNSKYFLKTFSFNAGVFYNHQLTSQLNAGISLQGNFGINALVRNSSFSDSAGIFSQYPDVLSKANSNELALLAKSQFWLMPQLVYTTGNWQLGLQAGMPLNRISLNALNTQKHPFNAALLIRYNLGRKK